VIPPGIGGACGRGRCGAALRRQERCRILRHEVRLVNAAGFGAGGNGVCEASKVCALFDPREKRQGREGVIFSPRVMAAGRIEVGSGFVQCRGSLVGGWSVVREVPDWRIVFGRGKHGGHEPCGVGAILEEERL